MRILGSIYLCWKIIILISSSCFIYTQTSGQDGHYWSENYGNRSMLLSGTVNASVEDLGAVYYNPGRLGLIENPAFVINAKVYEWRRIKIKDGINDGEDLNNDKFGGAPSLAAGTFSVPFLENHKFAYSFLTRQKTDASFFIRVEEEGDFFDFIPGEEYFMGKLTYNTKFRDEWLGITWSPPAGEKFSFGVSTFVSMLNRSSQILLNLNALSDENKVSAYYVDQNYSYDNYGILWKIGAAWSLKNLNIGLTVTTPKISVYGSGSTNYEEFMINVDTTTSGGADDLFLINYQSNLSTKHRSPWAIGLGFGIPVGNGIIHLSAEWFSRIPKYSIMSIEPFYGQSNNEEINFSLVDELNSIINFGIGFEYKFSKALSGYASFATDLSAVTSDITRFAELEAEASNSIFQTDFYKFGTGISIETKKVEITIGANYNGASQLIDRPINFPGEDNDDPVFDSNNQATVKYDVWRFILGFSFPFAEKLLDDKEEEKKKEL